MSLRLIVALVVVALTGPLSPLVLLASSVASEINAINVQLLTAAAIVLGFRWPATWAFILITKVTPGVGLLWFAVRREWRSLGIALGSTGVVVAISLVIAPGQWSDWVSQVARATGRAGLDAGVRPTVAPRRDRCGDRHVGCVDGPSVDGPDRRYARAACALVARALDPRRRSAVPHLDAGDGPSPGLTSPPAPAAPGRSIAARVARTCTAGGGHPS